MIDKSGNNPPPAALPGSHGRVRDVVDFHLRWNEFRPVALSLGQSARLSPTEADTLAWMIALLDRIGPQDLDSSGG